ncbi:LysR family transcriptional regulator [Acidisphaera sp. L21]|uniref:LysR family transcriptional regulator n=1 Tax=Acidisphaera sp. L21 TaxID=1641851 RepID=UPI00131B766F|nr:LysR family transcriptional regulator [Acidisphaera sp. L21]
MTTIRHDLRDEPAEPLNARSLIGQGLSARALEVFVAVARTGSMSAAAQHLGLTQPAVSQFIGQMERALDVQLFDRSRRPPVLTLKGAALLEPARALVNGIERFDNALRWSTSEQLPLLRIGMLNSFAEAIGPAVLSRLRSMAAQLTVESGFNATRARAVADREFDFVVTSDESPPLPGVTIVPIMTEPFLIVAPPDYAENPQALKPLSETLDLIRFGRDPFMNSRFDQTLRSWGITPRRRYHMDTHAAVLAMVAAGFGWTIMPPLAVYRAIARGERFAIAPYPDPSMKRVMMIAARDGEGAHVVRHIHEAATLELRSSVIPVIRTHLPEVAHLMTLHELAEEEPGSSAAS